MSASHRRYGILIPLSFNDGSPVPEPVVAETLLELRRKFGAVSAETQTIIGEWEHLGVVYRDEHLRLFVDVADSPENRAFFLQFKESLKLRFQQADIWLTSHPLEVL